MSSHIIFSLSIILLGILLMNYVNCISNDACIFIIAIGSVLLLLPFIWEYIIDPILEKFG